MNQRDLPHPDASEENRARLAREFKDACRSAGMDIVPQKLLDELVDVAVAECIELRERVAKRILGVFVERECGVTAEQVPHLQTVVEYHFEDEIGNIRMIPEVLETTDR